MRVDTHVLQDGGEGGAGGGAGGVALPDNVVVVGVVPGIGVPNGKA